MKKNFFQRYLDDGEKVMYVAHRNVLIFHIDSAKTLFFGICLPLFFFYLFPQFFIAYLIWGLVGLLGMLYHFIDWYFDVWILTNNGIVDIDRNGLLDVTSTRVDYHMIEGIEYSIKGFWATLFNFGDITVDKIGAKTSVMLKDANRPKRLERILIKFQDQFVFEKSVKDHNALKNMLSEMIAYHVQNEKINIADRD